MRNFLFLKNEYKVNKNGFAIKVFPLQENDSFKMPVVYLKQQSDNFCVAVWQIQESLDQMTALHEFEENDQTIFEGLKKVERRLQWLCSRYLIEQLYPGAIVSYNTHGKPFLRNGPFLSISHTNGFVAVALSLTEVGVDIQAPNEKLLHVADKFSAEDDLKLFEAEELQKKLQYIWTVKEAVFKTYGSNLSFKDNIRLKTLSPDLTECTVRVQRSGFIAEHLVQMSFIQNSIMAYLAK